MHTPLNDLDKMFKQIQFYSAWKVLFSSNHFPISYPNKVYTDIKSPNDGSYLSI